MNDAIRVALVTGANRGMGLETCRQLAVRGYAVVLGTRDLRRGEEAAKGLAGEGLPVIARRCDVTDDLVVDRLRAEVEEEFGRLDALVNNAGVYPGGRAAGIDLDVVREALEINTVGPWRMCEAFVPLMLKNRYGRIVNVSTGYASLAKMGAGVPAYKVSKAALNAFTRVLAAELRGTGILVNAVDPGWVATEMGGWGGRPVEEGSAGAVWAATLPDDGPTGGFFYDGEPGEW